MPVTRRTTRKRKPAQLGANLGTFRVKNRALLVALIAKTTNTTYPFGATTVDLSKEGLANASLGWLANLMSLYDLFRVNSIHLEWVPSVSAFASGSVAFYYDPTPKAKAPKTFAGVSGNANVVTTQVSKPVRHSVGPRVLSNRLQWYLTDSLDPTTASQGSIVVCQSQGSIPSATGDVMLGSVWITYDITLRNPTYLQVASFADEVPQPPLIDQLIFDNVLQISDKLDRQITAQEDTAESCQIIASKPSIGAGVANDITTTARASNKIAEVMEKLDVTNVNRLASSMANPADAPVIYRKDGWARIRTGD